jgi:hypothetical protein
MKEIEVTGDWLRNMCKLGSKRLIECEGVGHRETFVYLCCYAQMDLAQWYYHLKIGRDVDISSVLIILEHFDMLAPVVLFEKYEHAFSSFA